MLNTSRRKFLSASLVAGVTTSFAPRLLRAANVNDEIGLGFIGCGVPQVVSADE